MAVARSGGAAVAEDGGVARIATESCSCWGDTDDSTEILTDFLNAGTTGTLSELQIIKGRGHLRDNILRQGNVAQGLAIFLTVGQTILEYVF